MSAGRQMAFPTVCKTARAVGFALSASACQNPFSLPNEWPRYGIGDPMVLELMGRSLRSFGTRSRFGNFSVSTLEARLP